MYIADATGGALVGGEESTATAFLVGGSEIGVASGYDPDTGIEELELVLGKEERCAGGEYRGVGTGVAAAVQLALSFAFSRFAASDNMRAHAKATTPTIIATLKILDNSVLQFGTRHLCTAAGALLPIRFVRTVHSPPVQGITLTSRGN